VLDSAAESSTDTKWSKKVLQGTSLLVDDILSSALVYVSRGDDVANKPDHTWSREAIRASCIIIRDVMAKQPAQPQQQPTSQTQPHEDFLQDRDLVDVEFEGDEQDVISQPSAGLVDQVPADQQDPASPAVDETPTECDCCYDNESVFNDSTAESESLL